MEHNQNRMMFARTLYIHSLPSIDRAIYEFVDELELEAADVAVTSDHFLQLLRHQSPIELAAEKFNRTPKDVYELVMQIERNIQDELDAYSDSIKFVDYTDVLSLYGDERGDRSDAADMSIGRKKLFLMTFGK
ncbi:hypothetical protein FLK61_41075 [Paenalkalicoccus suaedae]|uniref:Uncharacterized protein n=1 Tax=Paenalkalicoccus suaedae TaxID=2592382 RepID=A0A859FJK4_9BACI|nr:hypothetical protein [Paenalkalicoccus suaedae]QKS72991.1 hypothetical protein FLK61_41075 [Paenalkalicoccus suaedae]